MTRVHHGGDVPEGVVDGAYYWIRPVDVEGAEWEPARLCVSRYRVTDGAGVVTYESPSTLSISAMYAAHGQFFDYYELGPRIEPPL
jgi:hypothetical protein